MKFTPKLYLGILGVLLAIGEPVGMSSHPSHVTVAAAPAVQANTVIMPAVQPQRILAGLSLQNEKQFNDGRD